MKFHWDSKKAVSNLLKHGVSFEEAETVFYDPDALLKPDPEHSAQEERFLMLGLSNQLKVLLVVHVYKDDAEVIRIVSARKADKGEIDEYARRHNEKPL